MKPIVFLKISWINISLNAMMSKNKKKLRRFNLDKWRVALIDIIHRKILHNKSTMQKELKVDRMYKQTIVETLLW